MVLENGVFEGVGSLGRERLVVPVGFLVCARRRGRLEVRLVRLGIGTRLHLRTALARVIALPVPVGEINTDK